MKSDSGSDPTRSRRNVKAVQPAEFDPKEVFSDYLYFALDAKARLPYNKRVRQAKNTNPKETKMKNATKIVEGLYQRGDEATATFLINWKIGSDVVQHYSASDCCHTAKSLVPQAAEIINIRFKDTDDGWKAWIS